MFTLKDWVTAIVALVGAVGIIVGWIVRPIKKQQELDKVQNQKIDEIIASIEHLKKQVEANQCEYVRDRLQTLREHYCREIGWATAEEKRRIIEWYESYRAKGFNHLSTNYVHDIESLPEYPNENK